MRKIVQKYFRKKEREKIRKNNKIKIKRLI